MNRRTLDQADRRLLAAAVRRRSPSSNRVMTTASTLANRSVLWLGIAAGMWASGRRDARSAAASGVLGIVGASALVNGPLKFVWRRARPPLLPGADQPLLPLPRTFSFPSGHSASALAFATGATRAMPVAGPVLLPMAGTVAYSRVHTGVHYPSDVIVGSAFGVAAGLIGARVVRRMRARSIQRVDAAAIDVAVPRTAVLVTSADSGSADGLQAAQDELAAAGWRIAEVVDVADCDGLPARLRETADPPLVIAAGGDGTVCAALNAMHETDALLAIVPLGTSNDVARSLGIPPDPVEAVRVIAGGRVCRIDAAVVSVDGSGERSFLNAATVGLNVTFAREATDARLRRQFGKLAYPVAAARALRRYEPFECDLDLDGRAECRRAVHVSISNAPVFGGLLGMRVPNASITDGLLDVSVVERLSLARLTLAVIDNFVGRHRPVHRVHTWQARSVRLRSSSAQEIAMDGEVLGKLPAEFEVRAGAVRVVVPPN